MSSHTFNELEKWHKSIIHRYGYIVMQHMSHKVKSYCEELDFFIEKANEKLSATLDSSRKSDIRIMINHIEQLQKHAEPMCRSGKNELKKEESEKETSVDEEEDNTSIMSTLKSMTSGIFGTSKEEKAESNEDTESTSSTSSIMSTATLKEEESTGSVQSTESGESGEQRRKRAMSHYNLFVKERYDDLKEEYPDKSTPDLMKMISEEWKSKKDSYKPSASSSSSSSKETEEESEMEEESSGEESSEESESENEEESKEESDRDIEETLEETESVSSQKEKKVFDGGNSGNSGNSETINSWKQKLSKYYGL